MLDAKKVDNTISLLENSCTIAFIARYRKEATGGLDEVQISLIVNALKKAKAFDERKEAILKSIDLQNLLTSELKEKIENIDISISHCKEYATANVAIITK